MVILKDTSLQMAAENSNDCALILYAAKKTTPIPEMTRKPNTKIAIMTVRLA